MWAAPGFLPKEVGIIVKDGLLYCYAGQDLRTHLQRRAYDITVYELVCAVADITLGDSKKSHIVSTIDTSLSEPEVQQSEDWHLFNDFLVTPVSAPEALAFNASWKTPTVLLFQTKEANNKISTDWQKQLDTSVLYQGIKYVYHLV